MTQLERTRIVVRNVNPSKFRAILAVAVTLTTIVGAAAGFLYYRSQVGPRPSFVLHHPEGLRIQEVWINGGRCGGVSSKTNEIVNRNVRPTDSVRLEVHTADGLVFKAQFAQMGYETREIQLTDANLHPSGRGTFALSFDEARQTIKSLKYEPRYTSRVYASPFQRALEPGQHTLEIEWEEESEGGTFGGEALHEITIRSGETVELTLDEILHGAPRHRDVSQPAETRKQQ